MKSAEKQIYQFSLEDFHNHASPSLCLENKKGKTTIGICGLKCCESSKNCNQDGLSQKTSLGLLESHLTKFFKVSKKQDTKQGHTLSRLLPLEHCSQGNESLSWPRPTTGAPLCGGTHNFNQMRTLCDAGVITEEERRNLTQGNGGRSNPALMEWLMGFPIGWTDLEALATP